MTDPIPNGRPVRIDDMTDADVHLTDILIKDGQLRMYKHFERMLEELGGTLTLEDYRREIKPAVAFLRAELDKRIGEARPKLIEAGLLKEE